MSDLLNQASLVMVPSGYKEDTVYSVVPSDGSGDLSFTRASNGTRVNSAGLVEVCPWNLFEQSNAFSTSPWTLTRATLTSGQSGYDNTSNAWKYTEGTFTANLPVLEQSFTSSSAVECYSFYLKAGTRNWVIVSVQGAGYIFINLTDGTVGGTGGGTPPTATTQLVGNGWYLVNVSNTGTKSGVTLHITDANNSVSYNGNGTGFLYVQNAQRNIGSTAKPYFPTTDRLNVPRLTYQNGGGGCPSLLLEKQSTNINIYSEDFSNAAYSTQNCTIATNQTTSPDGTTNADKLTDNSTNSYHIIYPNTLSVTASKITASVYVKNNDIQFCAFQLATSIGGTYDTRFTFIADLVNATITDTEQVGTPNAVYSIQNVGNGWYRLNLTCDHSAGQVAFVVGGSNSGTPSSYTDALPTYVGTGKSLFVWGAQVEASSYATSLIPTTSSSATRVADACFKTGISSLIGGTSGTVFFDIKTNPVLTSDNYKQFFYYTDSSSNQGYMYLNSGNGIITNPPFGNLSSSITLSPNTRYKIALTYANNDFALYVNGVSVATSSSGTPLNFVNLYSLGSYGGSSEWNEFVFNQYTHFPSRLTNAELASLTTI